MSCVDPIGDLITRIRNAQMSGLDYMQSPYSKMRERVLAVLKKEGYVKEVTVDDDAGKKQLRVELKYYDGNAVISQIKRVSKPGRRVYAKIEDVRPVCNGLGISVLSTDRGVMSEIEARKLGVGGEILCTVF